MNRLMLIVKVGEGRVEEGNRCVAVSFETRTSVRPRNQCRKITLPGGEAPVARLSGIKEYPFWLFIKGRRA